MNTAVLISGQMRSAEACFPSIKKHLLDKIGEHDIYAHVAQDEDSHTLKLFNPVSSCVGVQPDLDEKNYIHRTGRQVFGVQQVLRQLWTIYESWKLMEASGVRYDWVVRLRPDTQFLCDVEPIETWQCGVTIPKHNNWWGYCDRFAYMDYDSAKVYHSAWLGLDEYVAKNGIFHPETILKHTLDTNHVPVHRSNIVFDTLRKNGARIIPQWHRETGDVLVSQ